jgi:hypothetical protein
MSIESNEVVSSLLALSSNSNREFELPKPLNSPSNDLKHIKVRERKQVPKKQRKRESRDLIIVEAKDIAKTSSITWTKEMVEYALELRFDTSNATAKRFKSALGNQQIFRAWNMLLISFNEKFPDVYINDRVKISNNIHKLRTEYLGCSKKFRETGNNIEEPHPEADEMLIKFKEGVNFGDFSLLPDYWEALLSSFSTRIGLSSAVLGQSDDVAGGIQGKQEVICIDQFSRIGIMKSCVIESEPKCSQAVMAVNSLGLEFEAAKKIEAMRVQLAELDPS